MSSRSSKRRGNKRGQAARGQRRAPKQAGMERDSQLVSRCLAGDLGAWETLFTECQPAVLVAIRSQLGSRAKDDSLVEEIAAQLWLQLVDGGSDLLAKFDRDLNCRLSTYLAACARNQARVYLRGERRRKRREAAAGHAGIRRAASAHGWSAVELEEFLATLTPREAEFFSWCVEPSAEAKPFSASQNGVHQLRHRLRKKIRSFFAS